jgi:hypothetical protein
MSLNKYLEESMDEQTIESFREKAKKKIEQEKWVGRDAELKARNFVQCWTSEKAWSKILDKHNIRNEWAGTYVGDVEHAPPNYKIWINKVETTLGIRSRTLRDLARWLEVPYPDDRFRLEREKIHDYIIISSVSFINGKGASVRFYGAMRREDLMKALQTIQPHLSPAQQEYFRPVPLKNFSYDLMADLLKKADRK